MRQSSVSPLNAPRFLVGLIASLPIGAFGGACAGATALLLGESAATLAGIRTHTALSSAYVLLFLASSGALTGAAIGALVVPLSYLTPLRRVGFRRAFLPAFLCTVLLGAVGVLLNPLFGVPGGVLGYFLAFLFLAQDPDAFAQPPNDRRNAT